jgi:hypothetical protein
MEKKNEGIGTESPVKIWLDRTPEEKTTHQDLNRELRSDGKYGNKKYREEKKGRKDNVYT